MSINNVTITGNLTRDPELKEGANTSALRMSVAVNSRVRNSEGEYINRPNYVDCVLFGNRGVAMSKLLMKGSKVAIQGHLRYNKWEYEGVNYSKLEVIIDNIDLMQRAKSSENADI